MSDIYTEGWAIFDYDGLGLSQIQRIDDEDVFASDDDALEHVKKRADEGSSFHKQALILHRRDEAEINAIRNGDQR